MTSEGESKNRDTAIGSDDDVIWNWQICTLIPILHERLQKNSLHPAIKKSSKYFDLSFVPEIYFIFYIPILRDSKTLRKIYQPVYLLFNIVTQVNNYISAITVYKLKTKPIDDE